MAKKKKKNNIVAHVSLDGKITKFDDNNKQDNIVSHIGLDGSISEIEYESKKQNNKKDTWFEKGAFDDGYQFGDFSKTVVSSLLDVGTNATKGVMKFGEGIGDTLQYSAADVIDFFGNDKKADEIRNRAKYNAVDSLFEPATKVLDQNSVFGEKSDSISEGLGYVAAISAVSMIPGGMLGTSSSTAATITSTAATFTSSYGHGVTEALNSGATIDEARIYGAISGAAEAGSELMFGGLGKISSAMGLSKGALDDVIVGGLTKKIKNKMVKTVMQAGLKAGGEGLEEIVSGFMSAVAKKVTYMKKKDFDDILKDENLMEQFWMGAITSAISQGPSTLRSIRNGTDFVTGRTDNEQKVYDNLLQTRTNDAKSEVAIKNAIEQEKQTLEQLYGRTLNDEEIKKIEQKVNEKHKNGKIDVENTKLSRKEKLKIQESVNKDLEDGNISLEQLQKILGENQDLSKDKLLAKSVYENTQKYASYKIEKTDNEKVNVLLQSAADAGLNNTSKTRRKVELISKLVKDTDRQYKFVSPEQLKQLGYREDANGLIDKSTGEILINSHSDRGIQAVVGHETTHIFDSKDNKGKYSKEYIDLQDAVIEYAKTKGIYENTVNDIADRYGELLSNESEVKEELTADLIGDLLFNDEQFIESLATKNRNIFQKIYDYIKHIYNITKADTEEAKALEEVKYRFDKVYKNISEEINKESNKTIKYLLSKNAEKDINNVINETRESAKKNKKQFVKLKDNTIKTLLDYGINDYPMMARRGHIRENILTEEQAQKLGYSIKNKHFHGLGAKTYLEIIDSMDEPLGVYQYTEKGNYDEKNFIVLTKVKINGVNAIVPVQINEKGQENNVEIDLNRIKTVYSKNDNSYINRMIKEGKIKEIFNGSNSHQTSLNKSITDSNENVKSNIKYSMPRNENNTQKDNKGRELTKQQENYLKDSKARDKDGSIKTLYHGTPNEFTIFNYDKLGTNTSSLGAGFYFTDNEATGKEYSRGDGYVKEVYLDIKKPMKYGETTITKKEFRKFVDAINKETEGRLVEDYGDINDVVMEYDYGGDDIDLVNSIHNASGLSWEKTYKILRDSIGYDGLIQENFLNKGETIYVAFNSNQIKNVDNLNPTENDDIRYSITDNKTTGDDIAVKDLLKQNKTTIDDMLGPSENKNTVEDILMQTPEEKQQGMKEKAKKYINRSKTKFINNIVDSFGTSKIANTKTLNSVIDEIRTEITKKGNLTAEKTKEYFDKLYNNLVKIDTLYYDTYKNVKDDIRNTKIYISDSISNDVFFYNDFRKKNMGTMILTKDDSNIPVDVYYMEMSEMYPELFPSDIINPTDQLQRISDVAKDISKVETNVAAYNDKYMGKEYRLWAKEEFDKYVNDFARDIKMAERYNNESILSERAILTKEEIKESYKKLPQAKRIYEKALAKEVLTKEDKLQVDRLVNNEIDITEISKGSNKEGIIRLARAKTEYNRLQKEIQEYQKNIKEYRIQQAKEDIGNIDLWKDKNLGFKYSRETPVRNIYDIAPKDVAEKIANKYFRTYSETNEKKVVDTINTYNDRIRNLDIDTKNKYNVVIDSRGRKVSESALVQLLGEGKITSEDIKDAGANVNKIENAVKEFRNIYDELITQINESMLENGYAPVEYRKDYFPHFTEEKTDTLLGKAAKLLGINVTNREELPTDIAGQTANFKPGRTWFGNLLQRTTDLTDYDALKGFDKYVRGAADLIYHTGDIQNLRALSSAIRGLYSNTELQNEIEEINESSMSEYEKSLSVQEVVNRYKDKSHLSKFIEWLDNYTNILAGKKAINDRGAEKELNRQMYKTMQDIESRIAANTIGGNIGVSLTNFAPISQAWGEIKTHNLLNGMWQTMKSAIKKDSSFASESQFITRRRGADTLVESTVDKITKPINTVLGFADNFTSEVIVRSRYIQNLQEGMSKENALEEADRYASGLMADRGRGALPTQFSNKNPISKMINMFQTEVNNQWSYYLKDLPKNLQEKANGNKTKVIANTALAYTKIMLGAHLINELLGTVRGNSTRVLPDPLYIIGELIKGLSDDDDENDDETVISTITEVAGNIPFVSLPATLFADSMGLDVGDIGRVSISGAIPNVADITSDVVDMINKEQSVGDGLKSIGSELLDTAGASLLLPYGGGQIRKTVKGLSLYENDLPGNYTESGDLRYTVEDDVGSKIKSAIFGAYANPYAQDYIESGFKTIKKENIDEMVGLDMNSTEYRQYKIKLNKFSNKSEKLNYIDSLDLEDSQKSLAANNLNKNAKKTIDMSEYGNYSSYEEYTYARDYPEKYVVASQIATYDEYMGYKDAIADIKEQYSTEAGYSSSERKQLVQNYINTLDLDMYQKIMLEKMAGGYSIKNFQNYIYEYLESTNLTEKEKYSIWNELFN